MPLSEASFSRGGITSRKMETTIRRPSTISLRKRRIKPEGSAIVMPMLAASRARVNVRAPAGDNEGQQLGIDIYGTLKVAGWTMENPIVMSFMNIGGPVEPGIPSYTDIHLSPSAVRVFLMLCPRCSCVRHTRSLVHSGSVRVPGAAVHVSKNHSHNVMNLRVHNMV